jgi:hypothetical protein
MRLRVFEYETKKPYIPPLVPMRTALPQWYKDGERFLGGKPSLYPKSNSSLKLCVPFLDALTSGYMVQCPQDLLVEKLEDGSVGIGWKYEADIIDKRDPASTPTLPIPTGHVSTNYIWKLPLYIRVPKGYSVLFTHPLNRHDLPFTTLSGVVDADYAVPGGALPFFLKSGFTGIIPRGTPIAQLIPFKREDWTLKETKGLKKEGEIETYNSLSVISGWYKKHHWRKKTYN